MAKEQQWYQQQKAVLQGTKDRPETNQPTVVWGGIIPSVITRCSTPENLSSLIKHYTKTTHVTYCYNTSQTKWPH
jgi:hypothetical protein